MAGSPEPHAHTNRLIHETSPYLLQHAHNPVDWFAWGPEALETARREDRPILLSVGYSACHWCHVMERESFEDVETAELMNRLFVNVKVDREERPDIDAIYMQAVQAMSGHGGWPMTVFLTPEGKPFWGGTYFPPEDRHGMPSFKRVLAAIADAWTNRRSEVVETGQQLTSALSQAVQPPVARTVLDISLVDTAAEGLSRQYDSTHGGFGSAPKFPQPMAIELLLRHWKRTGSQRSLDIALHTLRAMANGGMYDQLGGGFHRYSVDAHWLVPHFEKMLYDNAQLARVYLMAFQATGDPFFQRIVVEILDYVMRDMADPAGGLYSTEDADSEGVEGRFYVWTPGEIEALLGEEDARLFCAYYGVTPGGNFEHDGTSILHVSASETDVAQRTGVREQRLREALDRGRAVLLEARGQRVRPGRDEKVLTAWNGMMLRAFAEAARVLGRDDYLQQAVRTGAFLVSTMLVDGRVLRSWKPGRGEARLNGYLEDYANLADGLLALYEATFDPRWYQTAVSLADAMIEHFADDQNGGFFDTSADHEALITRPKDLQDNATPAGSSVAADVLSRLALLGARLEYVRHARGVFELVREALPRYPLAFGRTLSALDFHLARPKEIAIVGDPSDRATRELVQVVYEGFLPNKVVAGAGPAAAAEVARTIPLLEARGAVDGRPTAYVCEQYTCQVPATTPEMLRDQLAA